MLRGSALGITAIVAVLASASVGTGRADAQAPAPTATPYQLTPALQLIVSGPDQAVAGSTITYSVDYTALDPQNPRWVFRSWIEEPLAFVSATVVSGSGMCLFTSVQNAPPVRGGVDCEVGSADALTGRVEITVRVDDGFEGEIVFGAFVPGTSIDMGDSITSVRTTVTVPTTVAPALPGTGQGGPKAAGPATLPLVLAAFGVFLLAAGGGAALRLR